MKKILSMGNALTDILFQIHNDEILSGLNFKKGSMQLVDAVKSEEITTLFNDFPTTMATGGSAANTIKGIAKLGLEGGFIGKVCDDFIGSFFIEDSRNNGIKPHLKFSDTASGHCTVLISPDGERTLCTFLGAASELSANDLDSSIFTGYDIFHIEGYLVQDHNLIRTALQMAKKAGLTVSLDLASYNVVEENLDFLHEIIRDYVDITFANEEEAKAFTGKNPFDALTDISHLCDIAIVKLGKDGSLIKCGGKTDEIIPSGNIRVDSTGAGDMYAAGFLFGLANDYALNICGMIGSLVSGRVVQVVGTNMSADTWNEIYTEIDDILKMEKNQS